MLSNNETETTIIETETHISCDENDTLAPQIHKSLTQIFGLTGDERKKWGALKRLGITIEQFELGNQCMLLFGQIKDDDKKEYITGYSDRQRKRDKACKRLGITEEDIENLRIIFMAKIGISW